MKSLSTRRFAFIAALILISAVAAPAAGPEPITGADYPAAFKYSAASLRPFVYETAVNPSWIGTTDTFWYSYRTSKGTNYYRVDAKKPAKEPLFDHEKLAARLSEELHKPLEPNNLPINRVTVTPDGAKVGFVSGEWRFEYDLKADKLAKLGKAPPAPALPTGPRGGQELTEQQRQQLQELIQQRQQEQDQQQEQQQQQQLQTQQQTQQQQNQQQQQQQRRTRTQTERRGGGAGGPPAGRGGDYRNWSPDRKLFVYAEGYNLYLGEAGKEDEAVAITREGIEDYAFGGGGGFGGGTNTTANANRKTRPMLYWSPDSKAFATVRVDTRGMKELFLVNSLAAPRPTLEKYKYGMPGEEAVRRTELWVYEPGPKNLRRVPPKWNQESYSDIHWGKTPGELRFTRRDRPRRSAEVCSFDVNAWKGKCILAEGFEAAYLDLQPVRYVEETGEMIWWSERSGWGHFYLYDRDGKLKNAITSGTWRASQIVATDGKKRQLYVRGNAREKGENVYYEHLYRVNFDGTGLTLLDPGDASHRSVLSPSRLFVVDNCSRVDRAPASFLRDASGKQLLELETSDLSRLKETGWRMPETFTVKAADGVTDLYGNMWKPFDFDPAKKYPIVAHVYPGPQTEGVTHTFMPVSPNQELAQLGFIVVQVGHRGGTPTRSKAYHSFGYFNMRDYGLADKKSAIEQLAARHPFIDVQRVGIYGHSGGGFMSAAALLQKPYNEFFKAAVASAGNHDNNIYNDAWAERYHGLKEVVLKGPPKTTGQTTTTNGDSTTGTQDGADGEAQDAVTTGQVIAGAVAAALTKFEIKVPTNAELAANLKGHLLLVHGEMDNNVHPANTMRLVDALIKANKRFDMLMLPGKRHGFADYQPYFQQRMWDFFAEHLLLERQSSADIYDKQGRRQK